MKITKYIAIRNSIVLLILCMGFILGCTTPSPVVPEPTEIATQTATSTPTELPTVTQTPSPTPTPLPLNGQQTRYSIDVTVNYYNRFITASSHTLYTNKTNTPLNEI
ncbi:MAG: hypothetical protein ACK2TV_07360, partial [Anaerolineales bacterium]